MQNARWKMLSAVALLAPSVALAEAKTWYVDPTGGTASSDSYDGTAEVWEGGESTVGPRKTLASVMTLASSGDTVIALPGRYDEGVSNPEDVVTSNVLNRVTIPGGVTLRSRDGAATTFIIGADAPVPEWEGCGSNAVRCAYVTGAANTAPYAKLIGFTLTGGRTAAAGDNYEQKGGGGVYGKGYCIDCIVSNNAAFYRGGGSCYAHFVRSVFTSNKAKTSVGFSMNGGTAIHCLIKDGASFQTSAIGSTFFAFPRLATHYNTLIMTTSGVNNDLSVYNCILAGSPDPHITLCDGSYYTNAAAVAISPDGRLSPGSVAIDAGNTNYLYRSVINEDAWRDVDIFGAKRIANGRLDVGCYEYDWYDLYSQTLSSVDAAEVTNATSYVALSGECLNIPTNGETVVLLKPFNNAESLYSFFSEMTGTGTLSVYLNGAETPAYTFTSEDGLRETKFLISEETPARFVCSGADGSAAISRFSNISYATISTPHNGVVLSGGAQVGTNYVAAGETLAFTLSRAYDSDFACLGVNVNGEFRSFDDNPDGIPVVVSGNDRSTSVAVEVVYKTGLRDWYVDANGGNDTNTGLYTNNAFRTLKAAIQNPNLATGEIIYALPGVYREGAFTNTYVNNKVTYTNYCRALLRSGMVLKSLEGPEKTIIMGAADLEAAASANGCGPNAERCLYMKDNTRVEGFTLTDGHSSTWVTGAPNGGGAAYCENYNNCMIVDCIVSNNYAYAGGAFVGGCVVRSWILWNGGTLGSDAFSGTRFINCYISNEKSGYYCLYSACYAYNCTFGSVGYGPRSSYVYNSLLLNPAYFGSAGMKFYNCVMVGKPTDAETGGSTLTDCTITNAAAIAIGEDYRPLAGSVAIDAGSWDNYAQITNSLKNAGVESLDLLGGQRVYNGKIDVGCGEYNWCDDFTRTLATRGLTVADASDNVTTNLSAGLDIPAGQSLRLAMQLKSCNTVSFIVSTETPETVSVLADGNAVAIGDGGKVAFLADVGVHTVEIICSGESCATVSGFVLPRPGIVVVVQ